MDLQDKTGFFFQKRRVFISSPILGTFKPSSTEKKKPPRVSLSDLILFKVKLQVYKRGGRKRGEQKSGQQTSAQAVV